MPEFLPPHGDDEELELLSVEPEDVSRLIARTRKGRLGAAEIVFEADQRALPADRVLAERTTAVTALRAAAAEAEQAARDKAVRARSQALQRLRTRRNQLSEQGLNQASIDRKVADLEAAVPSGEPAPTAVDPQVYVTEELPVPFARELVELLARHAAEVDEQIATYAQDWSLNRMPAVDRVVARLGTAELLYGKELSDPDHVSAVLSEWVTVARVLSTDRSPGYLNALLQRIADIRSLLE
jgi:transcription termination factor NusB